MTHSDDYGLDDGDDTAFLAAATQVEVSQRDNGFPSSSRPTKRRRVSREGIAHLDGTSSDSLEWPASDVENIEPPQGTRNQMIRPNATQDPTIDDGISDGDIGDYYFPGELGIDENTVKTSKYKIHVPEDGRKFPDTIFTQTQHGLDPNPARFRGAVWKRPPQLQPQQDLGGSADAKGLEQKGTRPVDAGIGQYFQVGRMPEDDAMLAARLQEEENALARQEQADRHRPGNGRNESSFPVTQQDLATQLEDLPSDAFCSSSEKSPSEEVIELSSQITTSQAQASKPTALRGPQTGLKQMTIFGKPATQELTASQAANKRHAWPLREKEELPTHHKLNVEALKTWVYPTNLGTVRDYQYNIVSRSLFHNTLVALPTGLGKTFIAATIMLNYYRWTSDAQLVFMAPTKPLIAQQLEACYGIVGIPRRDTVLMTGETTPTVRADEWLQKRVFFMTPQTVINDLKTGICDPKKIVLIVVDEAHKATGGYAYTEVASFLRRFNSSFRVLALTATPGSTTEAVQAVIDNLGIARVELRTEQSLDIREYTHEKQTETEVFDFSEEQCRLMELCAKALRPSLDKLNSQNAYWSKDPMALTAYGLNQARQKWMTSDAGRKAPMPVKGMMNAIFTVLSSLAHSVQLLKFHGVAPFYAGMSSFQRSVDSGEQKGKTAVSIVQSEHWNKMMSTARAWTNRPDFIGHPKLEYLREVVLNHFLDAGEGRQGPDVPPSTTRIMIFASWRDSTEDICQVLKRNEPMIRPHVFVGQAASKGQEGMNQKRQNEVIQDFKSGKYNTLVATSIGEEGLDIGTVDLIICYDASSSPIRMLQRIGRTGRKRVGRVVLLLTKGKEEADYEKAQDNYLYIQKTIADASKYSYRDDQSPRILPRDARPVADKRPVEIPVENSQPIDLNEKRKKAKGKTKRPPKKFHMPDGVSTGFVKASGLQSDDEAAGQEPKPNKKTAKAATVFKKLEFPFLANPSKSVQPDPAPLPCLTDVFLTDEQLAELQNKYARTSNANYSDGCIRLAAPKTKIDLDMDALARYEQVFQASDLESAGSAGYRIIRPRLISTPEPKPQRSLQSGPRRTTQIPRRTPSNDSMEEVQPSEPKPKNGIRSAKPTKMNSAAAHQPRAAPAKKTRTFGRVPSYGSAAGEGAESSPEPTPADMRLGTQGIDLGSEDTSGEDEEEEPDSELEAFVAKSSDPIEMASSSQLGTPARGRLKKKARRRAASLSSVEEAVESDVGKSVSSVDGEDGPAEVVETAAKGRKRRVVEDSDEDELQSGIAFMLLVHAVTD